MSEEEKMYSDEHLKKLLEENESKEDVHIFEVIKKIIPNWIIKRTDFYVKKYDNLQHNWVKVCTEWKTTPKEILLVEYIPNIENEDFEKYSILKRIIDSLTFNGYVVRSINDMTTCKKCNGAMLTETAYNFFKQINKDKNISSWTKEWSDVCESC